MKKKYLLLIALTTILVALLATACPNNSTNISTPAPFFPVQRDGLSQMDALLEGRLELDNGYLRVKYFDDNYLLIWPHGFSLHTEGEEIQVVDSEGQIAARVGETIKVGGGEIPAKFAEFIAEEVIGRSLPDDCAGPFWKVSEVITD